MNSTFFKYVFFSSNASQDKNLFNIEFIARCWKNIDSNILKLLLIFILVCRHFPSDKVKITCSFLISM